MESSSDFRGDLEDIVRAGRGRCGVVSESADKQRRYVKESEEDSSNNPSNLSKLTLLDEEYYFNFYCKERDYGFCNSDDVFGDPFSNTRDPLISSTTLDDEQMLHLDNDEICNNTNGFIMPVSGGYNSCRRSSSGLILETLIENSSDDNNINSKKRVIHGSEVQQQQQVDDSNDKMDQCMIINNNNNNHQRDGSRLVQISNIDFNHATAAAGGVTTTAAPAPAGCGFVYDYSLSSTAMVNSCTTTGSKDVDRILNMNPNKVGSVGCMSVSNRIQEISSSSQRINPILKRRKSQQAKKVVCIPAPGGANSRQGGGEVVPSDLWAWRKYGQKPIKGSPYPRGYYRCSSSKGCSARKQVERSRTDPTMLVITYTSEHNHPWPTQRNALAGSTRTFTATSPPPLSITTPSSSSAPGAIYKHDHPRKLDCTTLSTDAVTAVEQCRLELEDDDQNNSSSFGVSSSGEAEPILQFVGDDHDHARNSQLHQQMPFSSLLMGGSSTPSITNDDQKQLFSSTTLFDWPLSNQPL